CRQQARQCVIGRRPAEKIYSAQINRGEQSSEGDSPEVRLRKLSGRPEAEHRRYRKRNRQCCGLAAVAIVSKPDPKIWNDEQKQNPKQHRIRLRKESPSRE